MFRVIIAGTRTFNDYKLLCDTMDHLLQNIDDEIIIIEGGARGADRLGKHYAQERGYRVRSFPANWELYGKKAGMVRNRRMAIAASEGGAEHGGLVAFWDGQSPGTKNMIEEAKARGLKVRVKRYTPSEEEKKSRISYL